MLRKGDRFTCYRRDGGGTFSKRGVREVLFVGKSSIKLLPCDHDWLDRDSHLNRRKTKDECYRIFRVSACCAKDQVRAKLEAMLEEDKQFVIYPEKAGIPYLFVPLT